MRWVLAAALLGLPSAAAALDCSGETALPQQQMNQCAQMDFDAADAELNAVWREVRSQIGAMATDAPRRDGLSEVEALVAMQRAWIAYRDKACDMAGASFRGGSMEPFLVASCLADLTRAQTGFLRSLAPEGL